MDFNTLLYNNKNNKIIFLDGAMGTQLQAAGLKLGQRPETLCFTNPETVIKVHTDYINAGSDIIYANTFQANAHKLEGTGYGVEEIVVQAVKLAKSAVQNSVNNNVLVALDVGPVGELVEPLGTLKFEDAYSIYAEMILAGKKAGADLVVFETFTDLYDLKAAVLAAKENSDLPILTTMSFEQNHRTFTGCTIPSMAMTLSGLGVDALGFNCSLGPKEIFSMVQELSEWTDLPLVIKPNAGLPDPITNLYTIGADEFTEQLKKYTDYNVKFLGGCCGTTPEFIQSLQTTFSSAVANKTHKTKHGVCSASHFAELNGVRSIGERINPTGKKRFQLALREHDINYILERGIEQQDAGADILDVNVGLPGLDEVAMMTTVVKSLQSVIDLPLQIDSSNPQAIEAGLRVYNGKAIVNSVNGRQEILDSILPIVKKYGASVVGLTMDEKGIPQTAEERFIIAERILKAALSYGIPKEDIYIDCLTLTVSAQQEQAVETLKAVRWVKNKLGLHTVLGVSNISFGLPERIRITENFLVQAMNCGLDLPIINPNQKQIMDAIACFKVLSGEDANCSNYIERFANSQSTAVVKKQESSVMDINTAIAKGLKEDCRNITKELLKTKSELDIINELLIPALDVVGSRYEKGEIYLPQLINSANASCEAFEVIKQSILLRGGESVSKGKIILATVQGDIHDIGKNIVRVLLENYGYQVIDLGRDVPIETVVSEAIRQNVYLIGLSALMTTTVPSMEKTIKALRKSGHDCKVFVGGAVLTQEYADEIGADFYTKDAKQSVDVAKQVLG